MLSSWLFFISAEMDHLVETFKQQPVLPKAEFQHHVAEELNPLVKSPHLVNARVAGIRCGEAGVFVGMDLYDYSKC